MTVSLRAFLESLIQADWKVQVRESQTLHLNRNVMARYPTIPGEYEEFLKHVTSCMNKDETVWFLCEDDYNRTSDSAFRWNEYEVQSLEAAGADENVKSQIRKFWDQHLPIALSVKSDYAFLCIVLSPEGYGGIAYGREPEYEEVDKICGSFGELAGLIILALKGETQSHVLKEFL